MSDIPALPPGTRFEAKPDGFTLECSVPSLKEALMGVPLTVLWTAATLTMFGVQVVHRKFDPTLSGFGLIFVLACLYLLYRTALALRGKVRLELCGRELRCFEGVGRWGRRKVVDWSSITAVREDFHTRSAGSHGNAVDFFIELEGPKRVRIGQRLAKAQRKFALQILSERMVH